MKTNTIIKFLAVALFSSVLLTSCVEETFPENGYATTDQINESPFATGGVMTAMSTILMSNYTEIVGEHVEFGYGGLWGAWDRLAGEVFPVSGNMSGGNQYYDRWQWVLYTGSTNGLNENGWGTPLPYYSYYQFIFTANSAISIFGASGEPSAELGVAKAFRALSYMDMARLYDPLPAVAEGIEGTNPYEIPDSVKGLTVPIVTETMTTEELENNPRAPRQEMWAFILNDLNDAEAMIPSGYARATLNMPNLAVVYGLKARAYLWLGGIDESYGEVLVPGTEDKMVEVPTGNDAYRKAAEYARKAITESGCSIMTEAQWLDPTTGFCKANSAWMWGMCQSTDTIINNLYAWTAHMSIDACWGYGPGSQPGVSIFTYNRMSDTDFRKKNIVSPERDYAAIAPYTKLTEAEFEGEVFSPIAPCAWIKFHTNGGEKYDYALGNVTDIPMMRVEEMYLIEAEATAHYDAGTGKSLLATFMAHRDPAYSFLGTDIVDEIIFQKRVEFWGEGIMLYDLKRLNYSMVNGNEGTNAPTGARMTTNGRAPWWNLCIPQDAMQQNNGLTGYNNPNVYKTYISKD